MARCFLAFCVYLLVLLVGAIPSSSSVDAREANSQTKATHMRIQFKTEGGVAFIPHLSQLATVDSNDLSNEQREELRRLITEARFFELPQRLGSPPPGAADYQQHVITVEGMDIDTR
jgi:hypothetical protein